MDDKLKIAFVGGTGTVGSTLASRLIAKGHRIILGSRDPTNAHARTAVERVRRYAHGQQGSVVVKDTRAAVSEANIVIITLPCATSKDEVAEYARMLGDVRGKVVIDAINPFGAGTELEYRGAGFHSVGEEFAKQLPHAHVFKAFNTIGYKHMADPIFQGRPVDMMFAGGPEQRELAERVIADVGFKPVYVGPIRAARALERIAELWVCNAYVYKTRPSGADFAFAIVDKR